MAHKRRAMETDPTGRFVRYSNVLGKGSGKTVYTGFDKKLGKEIAWSIDKCGSLQDEESEILLSLNHNHVLRYHQCWFDPDRKLNNMITESYCSGNLEQYIKLNHFHDLVPIKNWCRQILEGLNYLHSRDSKITHGNVKCESIFINGNTGIIKLGNFGNTSRISGGSLVRTVFTAPEMFSSEYNHQIDIYALGITVLQMIIGTDKVLGRKSISDSNHSLTTVEKNIVRDPEVRNFLTKCLRPLRWRPSAYDLLFDPFVFSVRTPNLSEITSAIRDIGGTEQDEEDV